LNELLNTSVEHDRLITDLFLLLKHTVMDNRHEGRIKRKMLNLRHKLRKVETFSVRQLSCGYRNMLETFIQVTANGRSGRVFSRSENVLCFVNCLGGPACKKSIIIYDQFTNHIGDNVHDTAVGSIQ